MPGIFINFRVGDCEDRAWGLDERLREVFGDDRVFRSSRSIPAGAEFPPALLDGVRNASVVLVLIGPRWLEATKDARRRLDDPDDWVRKEIAEALRLKKVVIPVLARDAAMPPADALPDDISALARLQNRKLHYRTADQDTAALIAELIRVAPDLGIGTVDGLEDLTSWFAAWRHQTDPVLPDDLSTRGRDAEVAKFVSWLDDPASLLRLAAPSRADATAFVAGVVMAHRPDGRAVRVSNASGWAHCQRLPQPLVAVVDWPDLTLSTNMTLPGHVVYLGNLGRQSNQGGLVLPRLRRDKATDSFVAAGIALGQAHRYAGIARRSFNSLVRTLAVTGARPPWASPPASSIAAPLILVGRWSPGSPEDVAAVEAVVGRPIDEFITGANCVEDPLVHRSGVRWQLVDPVDAWSLLHPRLSVADLQRWRAKADEVLGVAGPATGAWSDDLRQGLADGAALLGLGGDDVLADGTTAGPSAAAFVAALLKTGQRRRDRRDVAVAQGCPADIGRSGSQRIPRRGGPCACHLARCDGRDVRR